MTDIKYLIQSRNGNDVASFDSLERAQEFRDRRAAQGVYVRIVRVTMTIEDVE